MAPPVDHDEISERRDAVLARADGQLSSRYRRRDQVAAV